MRSILLLVLLQLWTASTLLGQAEYFNYTVEHGLPSNECYNVVQDSLGYIWVASDEGIAQFDNHQFKLYNESNGLAQNTVFQLLPKGRQIWFFTYDNHIQYIEDGQVMSPSFMEELKKMTDEDNAVFAGIGFRNDSLIVICNQAGSNFYWYSVSPDGEILRHPIARSDTDLLLGIDAELELCGIYSNTNRDRIKLNFLDKPSEKTHWISVNFRVGYYDGLNYRKTKDSRALLSYQDKLFSFENGELTLLKAGSTFIANSLHQIEDKVYLIGNQDEGSTRISISDQGIVTSKGPSIPKVTGGLVDREGGHWVTSLSGGLFYCPFLIDLNEVELASQAKIRDLYDDSSHIYVDQISQFARLTKGSLEAEYTVRRSFPDRNTYYYQPAEITPAWYRACYVVGDSIWQLQVNGLNLYVKDSLVLQGEPTKEARRIHSMILYNGKYYLGTIEGLKTMDMNLSISSDVSNNSKLLSGEVNQLVRFRDYLLLATSSHGLLVLNQEDSIIAQFVNESIQTVNNINSVYVEDSSMIWLSSDRGAQKVSFDPYTNQFKLEALLNKSHGFYPDESTCLRMIDDVLWVGNAKGLYRLNPKKLSLNLTEPEVKLLSVTLNDEEIDPSSMGLFESNGAQTKISFSSLSYKTPFKNQFLYRLIQNSDTPKLISTDQNYVLLSNLAAGGYTFQVFAKNNDGILSKKPAEYSFEVLPEFYQTWWFITLFTLTIAAIIFLIFNFRYRQIQKNLALKDEMLVQKQKALTSQMNPHFIFNAMGSIQNLVIKNENDIAEDYLTKFAKLTRSILDDSSKLEIPLLDELQRIRDYMELENLRFNNQIQFNLSISPELAQANPYIPTMMIQTLIENAILHGILPKGIKGTIELSVQKIQELIEIKIIDDGIGVNESKQRKAQQLGGKTSKGFSIINDRLNSYRVYYNNPNYLIEIVDRSEIDPNESGTVVSLKVPYKARNKP